MRFKKSFRKMLAMAIAAGTFAGMPLASAEVKEYEGFGEYVMSDFETPDVAKQRAKARAEQSIVEQAGVYVQSYSRTVNSVLTDDEIITVANNIINIIDVNYSVTPLNEKGGGLNYIATIKATADSERIDSWIEEKLQEHSVLVEQNKRLMQERQQQDKEIIVLKNRLNSVTSEREKTEIENQIIGADRKFINTGWRLLNENEYIDLYDLQNQDRYVRTQSRQGVSIYFDSSSVVVNYNKPPICEIIGTYYHVGMGEEKATSCHTNLIRYDMATKTTWFWDSKTNKWKTMNVRGDSMAALGSKNAANRVFKAAFGRAFYE